MLSKGDINLLNLHNLRQISHCPPHFEKVKIQTTTTRQFKTISDWLYENLEGRFYIGHEDNTANEFYNRTTIVAFELPTEASYFSLMLNQII